MKIWRVHVNANRAQYNERSSHLVQARTSTEAIQKAVTEARKDGVYKSYDATSLELVGDAL
jgi:hypothetical protein